MQRKLRGSDIPAATEASLLHAAAFLEFKQHVAKRCILASAVLGRRQKRFLYTSSAASRVPQGHWRPGTSSYPALCDHPKFGETTSHRQR